MKIKRTTKSILSIIVAVLIIAGTSMVSAGAATQKTYLKDMLYSEIVSNAKENQMTIYASGATGVYECENALLFDLSDQAENYSSAIQDEGKTFYSVSYNTNKNFTKFVSGLTHLGNMSDHAFTVQIYGDNTLLLSKGINGDSPYEDISLDISNFNTITIKISYYIYKGSWNAYGGRIVFNNAYFTSEGSAPVETTVKPTVPTTTAKPITQATTAKATTATVATTKPVAATASSATTATSSTKATVAAPATNATSKISTADTANKTNTSSGSANNGTVQTGAASIAIIVFLIIGSLVTGSYAIYRKKKN